jgi:UDPglucose 6-dehydrogenase
MAHVTIIGSGVVGTATGTGFARAGHAVQFVDVDPHRVDALREEGFAASDELRLRTESFIFLTLPTPNDGRRWNLDALVKGTWAVGEAIEDGSEAHSVVVRSTVPPGTTDRLVGPILEKTTGGKAGDRFALASNPEFLRAECALEDFVNPWMTVIGSRSKRTRERLADLLAPFGGELHSFGDTRVPEMIKATHNVFNATKISFWNEMWRVAETMEIDARAVARVVARSAEGSINPEYGIDGGKPYGGACLPKDTKGFLGFAGDIGVDLPLLEAVDRVNDDLVRRLRRTDAHADGDGDGRGAVDPKLEDLVDLSVDGSGR